MKREIKILSLFNIIVFICLISQISALNLDDDRENRINFGHVMVIDEIKMHPEFISPGENGTIKVKINNIANFELTDVRVKINLPEEIKFLNSVSKKKIGRIESGEILELEFDVISLPDADEGIYNATITVDYLNHIGDERQDNDEFGILVIKGEPKIFAKIDNTEIYKGNNIGEVTVTFVNNNLANLKFLTVELLESNDYKILSSNKEYIGDLDSDDFESADFKLSVDTKKEEIPLKLKLTYRDALNQKYVEEVFANIKVLTAREMGITSSNALIIIIILILCFVGYYFYKRYKKKKRREDKYK